MSDVMDFAKRITNVVSPKLTRRFYRARSMYMYVYVPISHCNPFTQLYSTRLLVVHISLHSLIYHAVVDDQLNEFIKSFQMTY